MKKDKRKGSSFVVVVFVTAILFTTATTMIAVVTNDYKLRISESKKIENLYQSDSKLENSYNIIIENSNTSIVYATNKVSIAFNSRAIDQYDYNTINAAYKQEFFKFLLGNHSVIVGTNGIDETAISEGDKINNPLVYGILKNKYVVAPSGITDSVILANENSYYTNAWTSPDVTTGKKINQDGSIKITSYDVNYNTDGSIKNIVVGLQSTFKTNANTGSSFENTKTVTTKYTILAPDYDKVAGNNTAYVSQPTFAVQKAIAADGDLVVSGGNAFVDGDIWIKGTGPDQIKNNYSYNKYKKGISVEKATFNVTGNVSTNATYNLINNAKSTISSNLYALNAYVGPSNSGEASGENEFTVNGSLVTNNDLAVNSTDSKITLNNYYGISDKKYDSSSQESLKENAARESSSIIVNKNERGFLKAKNAYVNGLSYIDLDNKNKYQTGESIGVKGNYVAYTTKLPGSTEDVTIKNFNTNEKPAELIDFGTTTADNLYNKTNQFVDYFNQTNDIEGGGVKIDNLFALGAGVNNGSVTSPSPLDSFDGKVKDKQGEYASNVFAMGGITKATGNASELYSNPDRMLTVGGKNPQIDFTKITSNFIEGRRSNDKYGKLILNNDDSKEITISGTKINYDGVDYEMSKNGAIEAVIITKGNVTINGDVKFVGSIIAGGNVTINAGSKTSISYDKSTVQYILAQYSSAYARKDGSRYKFVGDMLASNLFAGEPLSLQEDKLYPSIYIYLDGATTGAYDANRYLKKGVWKLKKETGEVIEK